MKYMTDAHIANVSEFLKRKGLDCETVHQRMRGDERSEVSIRDPEIVDFLMRERSRGIEITLICNDEDLAGHCKVQKIPVVFIPELVVDSIERLERK